jgi:hypothetical protein
MTTRVIVKSREIVNDRLLVQLQKNLQARRTTVGRDTCCDSFRAQAQEIAYLGQLARADCHDRSELILCCRRDGRAWASVDTANMSDSTNATRTEKTVYRFARLGVLNHSCYSF